MRVTLPILALALAGAAAPTLAQTQGPPAPVTTPPPAATAPPAKTQDQLASEVPRREPPPRPAGRFSFDRVDDGFLRLDHQSGQVAFCQRQEQSWGCEAVPEHRAALERKIANLQGVIGGLKQQVADLQKEIAALRAPPPPPPDHNSGLELKMPSAQDMARARGFLAETWHRLVDMIQSMQQDMLRKS
jgi:hypothetical protein